MKRLTETDLANRWDVTPRTLQRWRRTGDGPAFIRIGERSIFYREEDVLAYEEASVVGKPKPVEPPGWRDAMKRAAGALDIVARQARSVSAQTTLEKLSDELRALLTKEEA